MKVYLDNCCYNRPFDDLSQDRLKLESDAILAILKLGETNFIEILGSDVLDIEIKKLKNVAKRERVEMLYRMVNYKIPFDSNIEELSEKIREQANIKLFDSLHIASALIGKANIFLTTDDKLIKASRNIKYNIRIINPVLWYLEVKK